MPESVSLSPNSTVSAIGQEAVLPISFSSLAIAQAGDPVTMHQKNITTMQEDEVLIRVEYASINKMDPGLALENAYNFPFPYVLGFDVSGEVVKVGARCQEAFKVGDEVLGWSPTGACYAEYVVAQRENIVRRGAVPAPEGSS
jgi:NADPH:quinone reductase